MKMIIFLVVAAWILWVLGFRKVYIMNRYGKASPIPVPDGTTKDEIYQMFLTKLGYPGKKEVHFDAQGDIVIVGKHGQYKAELKENLLSISRDGEAKRVEEAGCIEAYARKLFDTAADVNPYHIYKRMRNQKRNFILITAAIVVFGAVAAWSGGLGEMTQSKMISESYLSQYSSSVTIGEAFGAFFADGKWTSFSEGAKEYVDFSGTCTYDDEPVSIIIRFLLSGESFRVEKCYMDGEEMGDWFAAILLEKVYGDE